MLTRIEQRDRLLCLSVECHLLVRFVAVAVEAGQRQIFEIGFATFGSWNDMIYGKENVLPGFIGVAVLTQKVGALANLRLNRAVSLWGTGCLLSLLRLRQIAAETIQQTQIVVNLFVLL